MSGFYPPYYSRPETSAAPWTHATPWPAAHEPNANLAAAMHRLAAALEQFNAQRGA